MDLRRREMSTSRALLWDRLDAASGSSEREPCKDISIGVVYQSRSGFALMVCSGGSLGCLGQEISAD